LSFRNNIEESLIRIAMSGLVPARWFVKPPDPATLAARTGVRTIEIVSPSWQYAHQRA
jgi:hypothetical protein